MTTMTTGGSVIVAFLDILVLAIGSVAVLFLISLPSQNVNANSKIPVPTRTRAATIAVGNYKISTINYQLCS